MTARDMADFMGNDAGDFRFAVGERQEAAREMDIAARQSEGVDDFGVEHGEGEFLVGQLRGAGEQLADAIDIAHDLGVLEFAAELLHQLGVLLIADRLLLLRRHEREHAATGRRIGAAAGKQQQRAGGQRKACGEAGDHGST